MVVLWRKVNWSARDAALTTKRTNAYKEYGEQIGTYIIKMYRFECRVDGRKKEGVRFFGEGLGLEEVRDEGRDGTGDEGSTV